MPTYSLRAGEILSLLNPYEWEGSLGLLNL
jgi:hypothetical protein